MTSFQPVSDTIFNMQPTTCRLEFIPTKFHKEVFNTVGASKLLIVNSLLTEGVFPSAFKHALFQPILGQFQNPHFIEIEKLLTFMAHKRNVSPVSEPAVTISLIIYHSYYLWRTTEFSFRPYFILYLYVTTWSNNSMPEWLKTFSS